MFVVALCFIFVAALCFIFVAALGVWVGHDLTKRSMKNQLDGPKGTIVIVKDEVDGERYVALSMAPYVMETLKDGEQIRLDVEIRQ